MKKTCDVTELLHAILYIRDRLQFKNELSLNHDINYDDLICAFYFCCILISWIFRERLAFILLVRVDMQCVRVDMQWQTGVSS